MINPKRANDVVWTDVYTYAQLPKELKKLDDLAHNLWWAWTPRAKQLFSQISSELWEQTEGNPVLMLQLLREEDITRVLRDEKLMTEIDTVYNLWQEYMQVPQDMSRPSIAYYSMEYGLSNVLKIYSGGLGVLAGDYLKEASDSNIRLSAVGFLYRYGYFTQALSQDGQQLATYEAQDFSQLPLRQVLQDDGSPLLLEVPYNGYIVYSHVWRVDVGRIQLYLMDTDIEQNSEWDRFITHQLYGGDWENRMKQEYLLGIGGTLLLARLGINRDVYHMNEGHAALMNVQRLLDYIERDGLHIDVAIELVRASTLYTVHTPVPAGHDYFTEDIVGKYLGHIPARLGISWSEFMDLGREHPGTDERFSMSAFALNTCQEANGVSLLHGRVSQEMFAPMWPGFFPEELHVGYVTNGVHLPTWAGDLWQDLYQEVLGAEFVQRQSEESLWAKIQDVPSERLWAIHEQQKIALIDYIRGYYGERWLSRSSQPQKVKVILDGLNPKALFIGFGRRFATYKRAHLLFTDLERLERIVNNPEHPVQFLFTGKAHPADGGGQKLIQRILEISQMPQFLGKVIFLENYDMRLASKLISGVDIWLNTPTRPLEASGTSGEKAEMNGVLNLSVLDGWWYEGYREGAGWALTDKRTFSDQELQDKLDATTIYDLIEREIAPLYFDNRGTKSYSESWVQTIKNSLNYIAPHYTMKRMLDDYFDRFYNKLSERSNKLHRDNYALARLIVDWKLDVSQHWHELEVLTLDSPLAKMTQIVGQPVSIVLKLNKRALSCELDVELVVAEREKSNSVKLVGVEPLQLVSVEGREETYTLEIKPNFTGKYLYSLRIVPKYAELPHRQDFAYVRWIPIA